MKFVPYIEHKVELDYLAFEPKGVYKHGMTYTSFFAIRNLKIYIYLFTSTFGNSKKKLSS